MNSIESTKYRKTLEEGGVPSGQALAHADALGAVLENLKENLATKEWVREQLQELKFDILKWMISLFIVQTSAIIVSILAAVRYLPH